MILQPLLLSLRADGYKKKCQFCKSNTKSRNVCAQSNPEESRVGWGFSFTRPLCACPAALFLDENVLLDQGIRRLSLIPCNFPQSPLPASCQGGLGRPAELLAAGFGIPTPLLTQHFLHRWRETKRSVRPFISPNIKQKGDACRWASLQIFEGHAAEMVRFRSLLAWKHPPTIDWPKSHLVASFSSAANVYVCVQGCVFAATIILPNLLLM